MPCPISTCGVWEQHFDRCQSLCPLLEGLGLPRSLLWAACPIVDNTKTVLRISCPEAGTLEIVDKTIFGRNATRVPYDGSEREETTRGGRKTFMLSATATNEQSRIHCRLTSRGAGWSTSTERYLSTSERDAVGQPLLVERHVLVRPGSDDVIVERHFRKAAGDEDLTPKVPTD